MRIGAAKDEGGGRKKHCLSFEIRLMAPMRRRPAGDMQVQKLEMKGRAKRAPKELIRRRKIGESIIMDRLKHAKAEGDLPPNADPADLARYLSIVIYGITIQAAGGATRKELRSVAELALRGWPHFF
jgi:hypothetical protein